jgi:hypothetical protein
LEIDNESPGQVGLDRFGKWYVVYAKQRYALSKPLKPMQRNILKSKYKPKSNVK